jgi:hypothetical protein
LRGKSTCAKVNDILAIDPGGVGIDLSIRRMIIAAEADGRGIPWTAGAARQSG